ncbi:hypothetical protein CYY_007544 [Polysphondylium violaceum]|uniref:Uncharacterized protein n=1 Tax=Polysphondylium violaceum TaxID=133409 RepID=A0A8J4PPL7_9MYCE|nr:hypothetical protein CYY_007544 [Polysphondylium violaceum]
MDQTYSVYNRETAQRIQHFFNRVALAYRQNAIPREMALALLNATFGPTEGPRYIEGIDLIDRPLPPLTENFSVDDLMRECYDLRILAIEFAEIQEERNRGHQQ